VFVEKLGGSVNRALLEQIDDGQMFARLPPHAVPVESLPVLD